MSRNRRFIAWNKLLVPIFGLALFAALIPFLYPIPYGGEGVLLLIGLAIQLFGFIVSLRTFVLATDSIARDLEPTRWALLVLAGVNTRQIVLPRWKRIMRRVWSWHLLASLMRIGFALALAQYTQNAGYRIMPAGCQIDSVLAQLGICADIQNTFIGDPASPPVNPLTIKTVYALGVLFLIGSAAACMTVAIGLLAALAQDRLRLMTALALRLLFIIVCAVMYLGLIWYIQAALSQTDWTDFPQNLNRADTAAILRQFRLGVMGAIDGGLTLSTLIMRPYTPGIYHVFQHGIGALLTAAVAMLATAICLYRLQTGLARRGAEFPRFEWRAGIWRWRRHIQAWIHPALFRMEEKLLRKRNIRWRTWAGVCIVAVFACVLAIVWTPRWVFMSHVMGDWLLFIAIVTFSATSAISFRAMMTAADSLSREWRTGSWELFRLTPVKAWQSILTKWWAVTRWALPIHLLTIPLRMGLAYGVIQYLHATFLFPATLFRAFTFISWNGNISATSCTNYNGYYGPIMQTFPVCYPAYFPDISRIVVSGLALLPICLTEVALFTALGIISATISRGNAAKQIAVSIGLRLVMVMLAVGLVWISGWLLQPIQYFTPRSFDSAPTSLENLRYDATILNRLAETEQVMLSTLVDGGVMAATNFMRPHDYMLRSYYLVHQLLCVLLGAVLYIGLTAMCLYAAIYLIDPSQIFMSGCFRRSHKPQ